MIDLTLTDEQEALRATVEEFARKEVAPVIGELYERGEFPYQIVAKMGAMGLFGLPIAEEYGGMGGDYFALCLALEELARVDSSVAITLEAGVSLGAMPIYRFGTEAQKRRWLPALAAGEKLGAFGLTEPGDDAIDANMQMLRFVPIIALQPLLIVWLGVGETTKITLIVLGVVFPIYVNASAAVRSVAPGYHELSTVVGLSRTQRLRKVVLRAGNAPLLG